MRFALALRMLNDTMFACENTHSVALGLQLLYHNLFVLIAPTQAISTELSLPRSI